MFIFLFFARLYSLIHARHRYQRQRVLSILLMTMRTSSISIEQENSSLTFSPPFSINFQSFSFLELKEAFALFDRVGGGVIRTRDLGFVMRSIGYETTPLELERMIREVDQDGSLISFGKRNFFFFSFLRRWFNRFSRI